MTTIDDMGVFYHFSRPQWQQFTISSDMNLTSEDLERLSGVNEAVSMAEVLEVYMPLACLIQLYIEQNRILHRKTREFLNDEKPKVPYVIGVAGSVASGKSTTSRILQELLSNLTSMTVQLVGTDGFLLPNATLEKRNLMQFKGFPESYDLIALLQFLSALKSGASELQVPIYSHHAYDIVPNQFNTVTQPDVLIIEGLNILQTGTSNDSHPRVFVSDFLDFTVFVDASSASLRKWYIDRVLALISGPMHEPEAYFHYLTLLTPDEVKAYASRIWSEINEANLTKNILPYKHRSDCILHKQQDHAVANILLRKL